MYLIVLIIIGLLVLAAMFDRSASGLAIFGIFVLLAFLVRRIGHLTSQVGGLENQINLMKSQLNAEQKPARTEPGMDRQTAPEPDVETPGVTDTAEFTPEAHPPDSTAEAEPVSTAQPPGETAVESSSRPADEEDEQAPGIDDVSETGSETPSTAAARSMPADRVTRRPVSARDTVADEHKNDRAPLSWRDPAQPNWFDRMLSKIVNAAWSWITGGNVFVRVGILILFMGMTFLIRYAIGQNLIPIELRLAAVGGVAIALLVWGWMQRHKKENFALVVQGGGIGLLYLTIFASFSLYRVVDSTPAFVMLGLTVILAAVMAVLQNARPLALFAAIGGFLAPVLTSSGSNNYIGLFSYYTVLNIGIFAVAWFKSWRILNLTGFIFTFAISGIWGFLSYEPEFLDTTQPFLIIFFLLYVGISILFALRRSIDFKDTIDSSLVFGTPLLAFGMQTRLVGDQEYGIAISAFTLAGFYLVSSYLLWRKFADRLRLLCETFVSLSVVFATLAIPFAIDASSTGSIWAIEGAGILWVSIRQQQLYRRLFAVFLILAAGLIAGWEVVFSNEELFLDKSAFSNSVFFGTILIAVSAALSAWLVSPPFEGKRGFEEKFEYGLLAYSSVVLLAGFGLQILEFELFRASGHLLALLAAATGLIYALCAGRLHWKTANWMSLGFFALLIPAAILSFVHQERLSENHGYLLWPLVLIALFYSLKIARYVLIDKISILVHWVAAALIVVLLFWEGIWQLLFGFTLLGNLFCILGGRYDWRELRLCSVLFLPSLLLCFVSAVTLDGNLVTLSSIGSELYPPMQPGGLLWPLAFAAYFYLLLKNADTGGRFLTYFYLGGALLIAVMLLWLGLWQLLLGASVLCWLAYYLAYQVQWAEMRLLSKLLLPVMVLVPVVGLINGVTDPVRLISLNLDFQLASRPGFFLWPFAFVVLYLIYWLSEKEEKSPSGLIHALSLLFLVFMLTWEISCLAQDLVPFFNAWHLVLLPIVGLFAIMSILKADKWPFNRYQEGFETYALLPLALGTVLWSLLQFGSSGRDAPLIWVPLLNPIDLLQCLIIYGWITRGREWLDRRFGIPAKHAAFVLAGFVFLWINVDVLRVVHHWAGIDWDLGKLIQADLTQMLMSLVWSTIGLAGTFFAARFHQRQLWIVSAVLLTVVVLKLFAIDLSAQDTIERIISFTGVGFLLTAVGYFSPIPPREESKAEIS